MSIYLYLLITVYILSSPLLNAVIISGGVYGPIFVLIGGAIVTLISFFISKRGLNSICKVIYSAGLLICTILSTSLTSNKYLYHSNFAYQIIIFLLAGTAIGLLLRYQVIKHCAKIFSLISAGLFIFVICLSLNNIGVDELLPAVEINAMSSFRAIVMSVFALTPLLLPVLSGENRGIVKQTAIFSSFTAAIVALYLLIYPYFMLTEERNLVLEICKNISLGRFFQRIEFAGVIIFLITSLLLQVYLLTIITSSVGEYFVSKSKYRLISTVIYAFVCACVLLGVADRMVAVSAAFVAGIGLIVGVIIKLFSKNKKAAVATISCLALLLSMTSCMRYSEIDTYAYPLIIGVESAGEGIRFVMKTDEQTYIVNAKSILDAKNTANRQNAKQLDFSQVSMIIIQGGSLSLLEAISKEIQASYVHNSVQVAVTDAAINELEKAEFSQYSGISEYIDEYKSVQSKNKLLDVTAFDIYVKLSRGSAAFVPSVGFECNEPIISGGVIVGNGGVLDLTVEQVRSVTQISETFDTNYNILDDGSSLLISLKGKKGQRLNEGDASLLEQIYNETDFDPLSIYYDMAKKSWNKVDYDNLIGRISKVRISH